MFDVTIVGAGMAGLTAARLLAEAGRRVIVLDKGRWPGGRLATRDVGAGRADHGAQFFTTRSVEFSHRVASWRERELVYQWSRGWSDGSLGVSAPDGFARYVARNGFRALMAYLAEGLEVRSATRVVAATVAAHGWRLVAERGTVYDAHALLLALPAPQALALLAAGAVALPAHDREALDSIRFGPCLCALVEVSGDTRLPEPGAVQRPGQAVSWIADNQRKGISPDARVLTVHAGTEASVARWDDDDGAVLSWLLAEMRPWLATGTLVRAAQLMRWRFATPLTVLPQRCWLSSLAEPLVLAGDAFGGPRVEGAALSGMAAAAMLQGS